MDELDYLAETERHEMAIEELTPAPWLDEKFIGHTFGFYLIECDKCLKPLAWTTGDMNASKSFCNDCMAVYSVKPST